MTSTALAASNDTLAAPAADAPKKYEPTLAARAVIERYQAALGAGRYFKLYNAQSPFVRLISGDNHTDPLPLSFLADDFAQFCRETGTKILSPMPSAAYLAFPLQIVTGTTFRPNGSPIVQARRSRHRYVNTFQTFEPLHAAIDLSPDFHAFLACLLPDPVERRTFIQYCAHMFQHPEIRPSWHIMLLSETGTGKGYLFADILSPLLCMQTMLVKRYAELTGRFANAMQGTILVQLDDCKSKREDVQTQLKSLMTEPRVLVEEKGLAAGMVATYTRMFLASNELVPLDLNDTERRWWIPARLGYSNGLTGDAGRKDRKQLIQRLSDWLKLDGAMEAVYEFFMSYDLEGFDPKSAPMTDTLRDQIAKSVTVEQSFATDYLADHPTKVLKSEDLSTAFSAAGMSKPSNQAIGKLFDGCGYRQDFLTVAGKKTRWWFPVSMLKTEAEASFVVPTDAIAAAPLTF